MIKTIRYNLLMVCLLAYMPAHAADDYLKMLEQEAAEVTLDESGQLHGEHAATEQGSGESTLERHWGTSSDLPEGLKKPDFEALLQSSFYGTYVFYRKLDSNDRDTVFYRYEKSDTASIEYVRNNILELIRKY